MREFLVYMIVNAALLGVIFIGHHTFFHSEDGEMRWGVFIAAYAIWLVVALYFFGAWIVSIF